MSALPRPSLGLAVLGVGLGLAACGRLGFDELEVEPPPSAREVIATDEGLAPFTTDSRTFVDVPGATLTLPATAAPVPYLILASARLASSNLSADSAEARLLVGGVEHALSGVGNEAPQAGAAWLHATTAVTSTSATVVSVQARDLAGQAKLDQLRLIAVSVADAQLQSEWVRAAIAPSSGWQELATLDLMSSLGGNYLVLGEATGREAPCTDDGVGVRVIDSSGASWPLLTEAFPTRNASYQGVSRTTRVGFFFARRVAVAAGTPAKFSIAAKGGLPMGCEVTHARLLAFCVDRFTNASSAHDLAEVTTQAARTTSKLELPPAAGRYLVLQSVVMSATATGRGDRAATLRAGGAVQAEYHHAMDNENYRAAYGAFYLLDTPGGATLETTVASDTANLPVAAKESVIHALGL